MSTPNLPPTRANLAAQSGEWLALFDCFECANGVYVDDSCSCCGARTPAYVTRIMSEMAEKRRAA
jgi:hypothetical protein